MTEVLVRPASASVDFIDALEASRNGVAGADDSMFDSLSELLNTEGTTLMDAMGYTGAAIEISRSLATNCTANHAAGAQETAKLLTALLEKAAETLLKIDEETADHGNCASEKQDQNIKGS